MLDSSIIFRRPSILSALLRHSKQRRKKRKKKRKTFLQCISVRHLSQFLSIWVTPLRLQRSVARLGHEKPSLPEETLISGTLVDVNRNERRGGGERGMNFEGSETHIVGGQFLVKSPRARLVLGGKRLRADVVPRRETEKKEKKKRDRPRALPDIPYLKALVFTLALVIASSVTLTRLVTFLLAHRRTNTALGSLAR